MLTCGGGSRNLTYLSDILWVQMGSRYAWLVVKGDFIGRAFGRDHRNRGPVTKQVWPVDILLSLNVVDARPNFCSPSPEMMTSPYEQRRNTIQQKYLPPTPILQYT